MKKNIEFNQLNENEISRYVPKELFVKIFLDITEENYITAEVKFVYGDLELNPFLQQELVYQFPKK